MKTDGDMRRVNPLCKRSTLPNGMGYENLPFLLAYTVLFAWCAQTFGEPYETAKALAIAALEADPEFIEPTLPNPYLPGFFPLLVTSAAVTLHILIALLQVWFVSIKTLVKYRTAQSVGIDATHVEIIPHKDAQMKPTIVSLGRNLLSNGSLGDWFFVYNRTKYYWRNETFEAVIPNTGVSFSQLIASRGLQTQEDIDALTETYGVNVFQIPTPTFREMYTEQLLQPLTVFQIFCVMLWMLDEYWKYSLFTLFTILSFEAVTVFQRFKSIQTLRGMGDNSAREVFVYRLGEWVQISSTLLLPGDIVSLHKSTAKSEKDSDTIPCDCVILRGSAVVNEASLTGESHPSMKEELPRETSSEVLDIESAHKVHVLFGGTLLMQNRLKVEEGTHSTINNPPDEGTIVIVIRTGFASSQGKLMKMIEASGQKVASSNWDALGLISMLLVFAIISSGYVLKKGLEDTARRSDFELLLHCVLIITSVIPPELPMQTAMAINTVLIALAKLHIFCTEPFRIPIAGTIDTCLFDKTGTITSDELTAVGVVIDTATSVTVPMKQAPIDTALVISGCHSLVTIDGKEMGDPVEESAFKAMEFQFDSNLNRASLKESASRVGTWQGDHTKVFTEIIHRNHFAAKLQRMSTVARVCNGQSIEYRSLLKGSPEAVSKLLVSVPEGYEQTYMALARSGMRVLAMGYKILPVTNKTQAIALSRSDVESNIVFAGFVAFRCLARLDSGSVISQLVDAGNSVVMITGDALLTATFVANEVGMIEDKNAALNADQQGQLEWISTDDGSRIEVFDSDDAVGQLKRLTDNSYELCVSGTSLVSATDMCPALWKHMDLIRVFARMTPVLKERVINELKLVGHCCLMCGDGANDVGALKQSHVGVALLGGFGGLNVDKSGVAATDEEKSAPKPKQVVPAKPKQLTAEEKKAEMERKQAELEADIAERQARGESWARMNATYAFVKREAERAKLAAKEKNGFANSAQKVALQKYMTEDMEGDLPTVKLGDASIASPFTSKTPSIQATVDILRQGRCALVTTLQMYQILALNCLISAYSLSVLYLDGIKYGDRQMTASGILMTISFLTLSRATPLDKLSPVRPLTSVFHPALFLSIVGQFALHLTTMIYLSTLAKANVPLDWVPVGVDGKFSPSLLNTVVFLISTVQSVSVFAVNYKGRPFMVGMVDNPGLLYSLGACSIGVFFAATERLPVFNKLLELVPFPSVEFANTVLVVLVIDIVGAFLWDRLMVFLFAPHILFASLGSITSKDFQKIAKMCIIIFVLISMFTPSEEDFQRLASDGLVNW